MRTAKRILLLASLAAVTTFVVGATAPVAQGDPLHPTPTCTWSVDKTASLTGSPGTPVTSLTLALGQTISVQYSVVVTRTCTAGFDPRAEGGSANVDDSYAGRLATHLFLESTALEISRTFTYSREITARECGSFEIVNTVDVIDSDPLRPFATATHRINGNVHCDTGCTLTQGYWKTHSTYGPAAKPNATWNLLPGGAGPDTTFFLSGKSWYAAFWTPVAGNQYWALAHQYMAARLNVLNGASAPSSVLSAISAATTLFSTYTPAQIGALKGSDALRKQFVAHAGTLGAYNEGLTGPGHCDE